MSDREEAVAVEELLHRTISLRKKLRRYFRRDISKKIYIKILLTVENILSSDAIDVEKLQQSAFGIGRVVSDGQQDHPIGKELWIYHGEIYNLCDLLQEERNLYETFFPLSTFFI